LGSHPHSLRGVLAGKTKSKQIGKPFSFCSKENFMQFFFRWKPENTQFIKLVISQMRGPPLVMSNTRSLIPSMAAVLDHSLNCIQVPLAPSGNAPN
jgi:hypothetical protein